jgi:hypothetical protein
MNIISVLIKVSDAAIILANAKHDEIHKVPNLEVSPYAEVVIHLNLSDGHPLKVGSYAFILR